MSPVGRVHRIAVQWMSHLGVFNCNLMMGILFYKKNYSERGLR